MGAHFSLKVGLELTPIPEIAKTSKELTHKKAQGLGLRAQGLGKNLSSRVLKP
jgi:hypothetical protein